MSMSRLSRREDIASILDQIEEQERIWFDDHEELHRILDQDRRREVIELWNDYIESTGYNSLHEEARRRGWLRDDKD
jgi:predicted transcriptional regulator